MRTKEIEFWVEPDDIERLTNKYDSTSVLRLYVHKDSVSPNGQMVKLIQELPERKVTISESEFDEAWEISSKFKWTTMKEDVKAKLFKE